MDEQELKRAVPASKQQNAGALYCHGCPPYAGLARLILSAPKTEARPMPRIFMRSAITGSRIILQSPTAAARPRQATSRQGLARARPASRDATLLRRKCLLLIISEVGAWCQR